MQRQLDLVFVCDTTGSMGAYLESAKRNIKKIVMKVRDSEKIDFRFALVEYKDHNPGDEFAFRSYGWRVDLKDMIKDVNKMHADGGGDGPESVACALKCASELGYRTYAAKVIVWIADAPPHGLGGDSDNFEDGCPCKADFQEVVLDCVNKDIQIYSIAAEILGFKYLRSLMRATSMITGGNFIPLASADSLGDVVIAGSLEEVGMTQMIQVIQRRIESMEGFETFTQEKKDEILRQELAEATQKTTFKQIEVKSIYKGDLPKIPEIFFTAKNMKELKKGLKKVKESEVELTKEFQNFGGGMYMPPTINMEMCTEKFVEYKSVLPDDAMEEEYAKEKPVEKVVEKVIEKTEEKEVKMEMEIPKEETKEFKDGEVVRITEKALDDEHQNKIIDRLRRKLMKK
ncbi:hypothetical protein EIN_015450 [Entamoeba invadens IP1]|uniref:hypothetical protein n=1 Tax=Entamoeba invadens IP1 TaxID=370355 RepID=UPI0002C3D18F|nr:hypothetical protein EIN_015450 [Entamoeba invadens IP1]ELP90386.1 hypothetical protein EIN_015450 [Entamoeba invadens IP1]|eukprot:XP_004257157.1 hypothetical protein EIN_015450 [Entamoeba invadens IP1]